MDIRDLNISATVRKRPSKSASKSQIPNVYFIFAGSKQHIMTDMFLSAKRPFYQSSQIVNLPLIDMEEYHHFANHWMLQKGLSMSDETFSYLYNKVDGQTWYIQDILNRLYQNGKEITTEEISSFSFFYDAR